MLNDTWDYFIDKYESWRERTGRARYTRKDWTALDEAKRIEDQLFDVIDEGEVNEKGVYKNSGPDG